MSLREELLAARDKLRHPELDDLLTRAAGHLALQEEQLQEAAGRYNRLLEDYAELLAPAVEVAVGSGEGGEL